MKLTQGKTPTRVVIIGRPNVGKSTLFNRLLGKRKAIVHNEPGVTRDRIESPVQWWNQARCYNMLLIDTGGVGGDRFSIEIKKQVQIALQDADIILFVLDAKTGVTPLDEELFSELRKAGLFKKIPTLGVINKADSVKDEMTPKEYYQLGLKNIITVSAEHGLGIQELEDTIIEESQAQPSENPTSIEQVTNLPRIAVVGRPNVGKSTLINTLLGSERMIVSPIAGTTVDPIDSVIELEGKSYTLVDTAGIRRKDKTEQGVEVLSVIQVKKTLENANIVILMLDASTGISDQDEKIAGMILDSGRSVIILMNKWDVHENFAEKKERFTKEMAAEHIRSKMPFLQFAPLLFVSAHKKTGLKNLGSLIEEVMTQRKTKIQTKELTEWIKNAAQIHNPKNAKFYMSHQSSQNPPTFICHVSDKSRIHFSLERHLVNRIRETWGFMGNPVRLLFKTSEGKPPRRRDLPSKKHTNRKSVEATR